jgi:HK97 family phage major capsid protein
MNLLEKAKRNLADAELRFNEAVEAVESAPADISEEDLTALNSALDESETEVVRSREDVSRYERIYQARKATGAINLPDNTDIRVTKEESTYRKDGSHSFFRDMVFSKNDLEAQERLRRHGAEMRDISNANGSGSGFLPPNWLADEFVSVARPGRPFADRVPKMPMPPKGETVTIPAVLTGTSVAATTAENAGVQEVDMTSGTITANLVTIAGQQDVARQTLERSYPGLDQVIFDDLMRAYDAALDVGLLTGSGSGGTSLGIRNVASHIDVAFTSGSPTGALLLPKIYDAVQRIASNRFVQPDMIVMHPRRAAWLAASLSSTFPLFQQGGLTQAVGTQNDGFVGTIAGLPVVLDPNVPTNLGAGTNQDEIYVVASQDFRLAEDDIRQATYEEVLSGTLTIRLQLFSYSFFVAGRYPNSIAVIEGTGLVAPTF